MLTLPILFSILCSACFSQLLNCSKEVSVPSGQCRNIDCYFSIKPKKSMSVKFSGFPQYLIEFKQYTFQSPTDEPKKSMAVCSLQKGGPLGKVNVTYSMTIDNVTSNQPTGTSTIIIEKPIENPNLRPVVWKNYSVKGTCTEFDVATPGVKGTLYYSVRNVFKEPYQFIQQLLEYCKEFNRCESFGMDTAYLRLASRESDMVIIEKKKIDTNQTKIRVRNDLIEGTNYNICAFYRIDETKDNSATSCQLFNTDTSENMLRARFKFTQNTTQQKYNIFLCFLTKYLGAQIKDVITIDGYSCNEKQAYPERFYYYRPTTIKTKNSNQTIVYVSLGCAEADNKILEPNWNRMWDKNGNLSPLFRWVLQQNKINWVQNGTNLGQKNMGELLKPKDINAQFNAKQTKIIQGNRTMIQYKVQNITSDSPGIVYFIQMIFILQKGGDPSFIPTVNRTIQCNPSQNTSIIIGCARAVLTGPVSQQPYIRSLIPERYTNYPYVHKIYYVEAGEYPKFPIASWRKIREIKFEEAKGVLRVNRQLDAH